VKYSQLRQSANVCDVKEFYYYYTVSQKTSPMFLATTRESIVRFAEYLALRT